MAPLRAPAIEGAALRVVAALVLASIFAAALHDVSQAWDVWSYHLPFAARLAGVVPEDAFAFHPTDQARFAGFPLLAERLQGALWRVTGRAESTNLVAFASVPLVAWFLRRRFAVPWHLTVLALFAIPLVQTHATSAYVDLPANAALSVVVVVAIEAWASADRPRAGTLVLAAVAAAIAANMKALLHPATLAALVAIGARLAPWIARDLRDRAARGRAWRTLAAIAIALPVVFATPLANLVAHGNPYYPIQMSVLGHALPGIEAPYAASPPWLEGAPRPVRFACSVLEMGVRPLTDRRRWTVDQWMPSDAPGARMGGFFGAYAVAELALLGWRAARDRTRRTRAAAWGFAGLTLVIAWMPQSHELRYYLGWMITLVAINLWLAKASGSEGALRVQGWVSAAALAVVVAVTRGGYALPSGEGFADLVKDRVDAGVLAGVRDGERICVAREPYNLLWAAPFHAPKRYSLVEAETAGECPSGSRSVDAPE